MSMSESSPASHAHLTAESMRAHAHPVRLRILGRLRADGPATATALAREFGLNSGATSYHLRQLATHKLIEEATELGKGRERWWRAAHVSTYFDSKTLSGEAGESFLRAIAQVHFEQTQRTIDQHVTMPEEWQSVLSLSDWMLNLTQAEAARLGEELRQVLDGYRKHGENNAETAPADAKQITVQYQILPRMQAPDPSDA